jgi:hypothetical protein
MSSLKHDMTHEVIHRKREVGYVHMTPFYILLFGYFLHESEGKFAKQFL